MTPEVACRDCVEEAVPGGRSGIEGLFGGRERSHCTALGAQTEHDHTDMDKSEGQPASAAAAAAGLFTPDGAPAPSPSSYVRKGMCYRVPPHALCQGLLLPSSPEGSRHAWAVEARLARGRS